MAQFSITVWVNVDAESYEDAYRVANDIVEELDIYGTAGIGDVEELEE